MTVLRRSGLLNALVWIDRTRFLIYSENRDFSVAGRVDFAFVVEGHWLHCRE